jgi:DNA polymerase-3 subunit epsilon
MRQVVLDTETTGLSWEKGNRVVEIGCVELVERRPTGRTFQRYLNPECPFEPGAQEVTGLTLEFLADKPKFAEVVDEFLAFIDGAELVIHNAAFDVGFLDPNSRARPHLGRCAIACGVEDSLNWRGKRSRASAIRWMRCAAAGRRTTRTATCTARCSTPSCSPRPTSR